jgi:hypothetical protein
MSGGRVRLALLAPLLSYGAVNQLPAHFEPRDDGFLARTGQGSYLLTETGALRFSADAEMRFAGANPAVQAEPIRRLPGKTNYLRGTDPARWRTGVPHFGGLRYANLYPGVDLIYHADAGLEYDLSIAPRVSPRRIAMEFSGSQSVHLGRDGELIVRAGDGELHFDRPHISQDGRAVRLPLIGHPPRGILDRRLRPQPAATDRPGSRGFRHAQRRNSRDRDRCRGERLHCRQRRRNLRHSSAGEPSSAQS